MMSEFTQEIAEDTELLMSAVKNLQADMLQFV